MTARFFIAVASLIWVWGIAGSSASAQTSYDQTIQDYLTFAQQRDLARAALKQYGILPDRGHGPEVDVRLQFPTSQTGLDNIEMVMLEPVGSGAHECMSIAVKRSSNVIEAYFHSKKDARPGKLYDVVVSDAMGDKFWTGRILVSRQNVQRDVINAPLLTPGSPHYKGPQSAPMPKLGFYGEAITPSLLREAHLSRSNAHGLLVLQLWPGSLTQRLGLRVGDVVLAYDGQAVASVADLARLEQQRSGVWLAVARAGRVVYLGSRPSAPAPSTSTRITYDSPQGSALLRSWIVREPSLGMNLLLITPQLIDLLPHPRQYEGVHGVIVLDVAPQGWASTAGLQKGDVVSAVRGEGFASIAAFLQLLAQYGTSLQLSVYRDDRSITLEPSQSQGWQPPTVGPGFIPPATPQPR